MLHKSKFKSGGQPRSVWFTLINLKLYSQLRETSQRLFALHRSQDGACTHSFAASRADYNLCAADTEDKQVSIAFC